MPKLKKLPGVSAYYAVPVGSDNVLKGGKTPIQIVTTSNNKWLAQHLRDLAAQVEKTADNLCFKADLRFEVIEIPKLASGSWAWLKATEELPKKAKTRK